MVNPVPVVRITAVLLALLAAGCQRPTAVDGAGTGRAGDAADAALADTGSADGSNGLTVDALIQRAEQAAQVDDFAAAERWLVQAGALVQMQQELPVEGSEAAGGQGRARRAAGKGTHTEKSGPHTGAGKYTGHGGTRPGERERAGAVADPHLAMDSGGAVPDPAERIAAVRAQIGQLHRTRIARLHAQGVLALNGYDGSVRAAQVLRELERIAPADSLAVADLRQRIDWAARYGAFAPGQVFVEPLRGGGYGPQMAVIASGAFQLGSVDGDADAPDHESPPTPVRFARGFALAVHEVSVGEFARFIAATGYRPRAARRGFSLVYDERSGNFVRRSGVDWRADFLGNPADPWLPVLHVSARDAKAYADWLSAQTGAVYRLPSEAEFEYALRAGGSDVYPWPGNVPPPGAGNLTGSEDRSASGRHWANAFAGYGDGHWGPAAVGSFAANAFGIHDLAGNVSEWVADCWHANYRRAPQDGSAWVNPGCRDQVIRGGSWASSPAQTRASWRAPAPVDTTNARVGFRVARVL